MARLQILDARSAGHGRRSFRWRPCFGQSRFSFCDSLAFRHSIDWGETGARKRHLSESDRRANLRGLREPDGSERRVLQVPQLRLGVRLFVNRIRKEAPPVSILRQGELCVIKGEYLWRMIREGSSANPGEQN